MESTSFFDEAKPRTKLGDFNYRFTEFPSKLIEWVDRLFTAFRNRWNRAKVEVGHCNLTQLTRFVKQNLIKDYKSYVVIGWDWENIKSVSPQNITSAMQYIYTHLCSVNPQTLFRVSLSPNKLPIDRKYTPPPKGSWIRTVYRSQTYLPAPVNFVV